MDIMTKSIDQKALDLAIANLEKQFGKGTVITGDAMPEEVEVISTGNFKLDIGLGVGGLPKGRIVEIFGGEALGKSLIALNLVAACQAAGGKAAYIDVECDLDPEWAAKNGVIMSDLIIAQPEYGEAAFTIVETLIRSGQLDLVVVDSVAAMTPKAELDGEMEDLQVGAQARMMAKGLRKVRHAVLDTNTCLVFINQIRDKIGFMQQGTTSPGGRSLKFYSSVRIELKKMGDIKDTKTGESKGTRVKAIILKNKVADPYKIAEYDILHGMGFNNFGSILELAEKFNIILRKGAYYYKIIDGVQAEKTFAQGETNAIEYLASDLEYCRQLENEIKENVKALRKSI